MAGAYYENDFDWSDIVEESEAQLKAQNAASAGDSAPAATSFDAVQWEHFHAQHSTARFFKQRRYLPLAFPQLLQESPPLHIVEVGCGCGASIVPVLKVNRTCRATVCDVSPTAIALLQQQVLRSAGIEPSRVHAFAYDATSRAASGHPLADATADYCLLVFTLSAVAPPQMGALLDTAASSLRPGGHLLVRDYGLYDMTQLRFPPAQKLQDRLYFRSDGTLAYFFSKEDLTSRCMEAGLECMDAHYACVNLANRKNGKLMRRVFIQAVFRKPV